MSKKCKTLFLTFTMFFSVMLFNIDGVKAVVNDADGSGYATCYYRWTDTSQESVNDTGQNITYNRPYKLGVTFYKTSGDTWSSYRAWATLGCGNIGDNSTTQNGICSISNYNDVFYDISNLQYREQYNSGTAASPIWKCPEKIQVYSYQASNDIKFYFEGKCPSYFCKTVSLCQNSENGCIAPDVQQSGEPDDEHDVTGASGTGYSGTDPGTPSNDPTWEEQLTKILEAAANDDVYKSGNTTYGSCEILSGITPFLKYIFGIIEVAGILLLIIMTALEFIKAITSSEDEKIKKAFKNTVIRVICAVILLLLPIIVTWILNIVNSPDYLVDSDGKRIIGENGEPLCKVID